MAGWMAGWTVCEHVGWIGWISLCMDQQFGWAWPSFHPSTHPPIRSCCPQPAYPSGPSAFHPPTHPRTHALTHPLHPPTHDLLTRPARPPATCPRARPSTLTALPAPADQLTLPFISNPPPTFAPSTHLPLFGFPCPPCAASHLVKHPPDRINMVTLQSCAYANNIPQSPIRHLSVRLTRPILSPTHASAQLHVRPRATTQSSLRLSSRPHAHTHPPIQPQTHWPTPQNPCDCLCVHHPPVRCFHGVFAFFQDGQVLACVFSTLSAGCAKLPDPSSSTREALCVLSCFSGNLGSVAFPDQGLSD